MLIGCIIKNLEIILKKIYIIKLNFEKNFSIR